MNCHRPGTIFRHESLSIAFVIRAICRRLPFDSVHLFVCIWKLYLLKTTKIFIHPSFPPTPLLINSIQKLCLRQSLPQGISSSSSASFPYYCFLCANQPKYTFGCCLFPRFLTPNTNPIVAHSIVIEQAELILFFRCAAQIN